MVFVLVLGLIIVNRQREYLRDPLATVYRNDVPQADVEVYQNISNDVLLLKDGDPGGFRTIIQDFNEVPATPVRLTCIRWLACMTDDDRAAAVPMIWTGQGKYDPKATMTSHEVSYVDGDGSKVRVALK
jgi:hypothetical protein